MRRSHSQKSIETTAACANHKPGLRNMESKRLKPEQTASEPVTDRARPTSTPLVTVTCPPLSLYHAHSPALRLGQGFGSSRPTVPGSLQAKLTVSEPGDQYEQEADRIAEQVMRMPEMTAQSQTRRVSERLMSTNDSPAVSRLSTATTESETPAPGLVHYVLRAPGNPLSKSTRGFFEHRFQRDFGNVRIHADDLAGQSAREVNAQAYTVGSHIVFARGAYEPNTGAGRQLLAHELTHVMQQTAGSHRDSPAKAARSDPTPRESIRRSPAARLQRRRETFRGRDVEVGDINLNAQADVDVRQRGVLLPGSDQAHILVSNRQLGYEVSHTTQDDPFRWSRLKEIVDTGHADISGIGLTRNFPVQEVSGGVSRTVRQNLATFMAGGITLPRLSLQQAINPTATAHVASANNARDAIFYESGAGGRGILGSNSLAHELFGHLWLAMKGVPFAHGGQITAAHGITDPMGRTFAGGVDQYIGSFAGATQTALQSPTQKVSPAHLAAALAWLRTNGANNLSFTDNRGSATRDFTLQWETLSGNYEVLLVGPQPPPGTAGSASSVVADIVAWFNTLPADKQSAFRGVMSAILTTLGVNLRTRLPRDVVNQLPLAAPAPAPVPAPVPAPGPTP